MCPTRNLVSAVELANLEKVLTVQAANPTKDSGHSGQKKSSSSEKGKNLQR